MAKPTLLDIVQDILSEMGSDEVNSISDTSESEQVARIVRAAYRDMVSNKNWNHLRRLTNLIPFGDDTTPTHMKFEEEVKELVEKSVYYNKVKLDQTRKVYSPVKYLDPDSFRRLLVSRNSDTDNVDIIIDPSGVELLIINNVGPTYFTSFNDETLVFDSYDNQVDSTLQSSKIQIEAYFTDEVKLVDDHTPNLPLEAFPALINEATSRAMFKIDQTLDTKSEAEARRQDRYLSQKSWRTSDLKMFPKYGRRAKG